MVNVTHRAPDGESWNVKYVLMRLPEAIRITLSSCSSISEAVISNQTDRDHSLNAHWIFSNVQCPIFTELQAKRASCTMVALLAEPLAQIDYPAPNDIQDRRREERRGRERRQNTLAIIKEFIDKSLDLESLDVTLIGRQFYMSRSSVYRLFESERGLANYIRRRRLMQAFSLLTLPRAQSRLRILDVALKCGFSSDMVFTRAFRKMFSLTPSMVRSIGEQQGPELDDLLMGLLRQTTR